MTVQSDKPLDYSSQIWRGIDDKFPKKIHNATSTSDGLMSAEDKAKLDAVDLKDFNRVYDVATWENDGLMSKEDKKKMDGIEENANNYIHPNNPQIRHVTDDQITYWNAKASTAVATHTQNGLMAAVDKRKLDTIEEYANNYTHPSYHDPSIIKQDKYNRFVTDAQIEYWNEKASTDTATGDSDGLLSAADKRKLDTIEEGANNYIHPDNEGIRHVSDAEKTYWNAKADKTLVTNSENGLMAAVDKVKLDGIEENANNYIHPNNPQIRHVTDEQIEFWNSKTTTKIATFEDDGLMSSEDKTLLYSLKAAKVKNIKYKISKKDIANFGKVTIPIDNLNDDSTVIVGLDYSLASQDQYEAASLARFKPAPISGGIEIYCNGVKPNIDIPASITIMGVD